MPDGVFNPYQTVRVLGQSAIPFILPGASSTTIVISGNAGVATMSGLTALPSYTASQPLFVYVPAAAFATGVPATAGFFYGTFASTTSITVYNNPYVPPGTPQVPATTTTFSSITAVSLAPTVNTEVVAYQLKIPAGQLMGPNDGLYFRPMFANNNSAGTKTNTIRFGTAGTTSDAAVIQGTMTTNETQPQFGYGFNQGVNTNQIFAQGLASGGYNAQQQFPIFTNINMATTATFLTFTLKTASAQTTDWDSLPSAFIEYLQNVT